MNVPLYGERRARPAPEPRPEPQPALPELPEGWRRDGSGEIELPDGSAYEPPELDSGRIRMRDGDGELRDWIDPEDGQRWDRLAALLGVDRASLN